MRLLAFVLCLALTCGLAGCLGAHSADEYGYVLMIGVDQGEGEPFYVTMLLQKGQGGEGDGGGKSAIVTGIASAGLHEAMESLEGSLPFQLELSRTSAIVFGEDAAKSGTAAEEFLGVSMGSLGIRHYANLIVARGTAEAFLTGLNSETAQNLAKLQQSFLEYSNRTGFAPVTTLGQFYEGAWSAALDAVVPLGEFREDFLDQQAVEEEGIKGAQEATALKSNLNGCALFDGPRMAGSLDGRETQLMLMGRGAFRKGRIHLVDPSGRRMSVLLRSEGAPKVTLALDDHTPKADFALRLLATIERPASVADFSVETLSRHIGAYIEAGMGEVFAICQASHSDAFGLGRAAIAQFHSAKAWEAYDWKGAYQNAEASFSVTVELDYNPTGSRVE